MKNPFEQVKEFHDIFDPSKRQRPEALSDEEVLTRIHFLIEELVEYLSTVSSDQEKFEINYQKMLASCNAAKQKILTKGLPKQDIVSQADALIDLLYFTYGTFVLMGLDPLPLFNIVHQANMGKLFPDGKPHYDQVTGKVLKPSNWERDYAPENKLKAEIERQQRS